MMQQQPTKESMLTCTTNHSGKGCVLAEYDVRRAVRHYQPWYQQATNGPESGDYHGPQPHRRQNQSRQHEHMVVGAKPYNWWHHIWQ